MTREQALQIVHELEAAANARDPSRIMRLYADDAALVSPVWGRVTGRESIVKTWNDTFARFPDWTVKVDDVLVDGDRIAFLGRAGANDRSGWFGQPPTGECGLKPRFATLVCGVLSADGKFVYANAGHNPPLLLSDQDVQRLTSGGPVLGVFDDYTYEESTVRLQSGDRLVFYSDGVTEGADIHGKEFGEDRLIAAVTGAASAAETLQTILNAVQEFCKGAPQADDITAVVARYGN